MANKKMTVVEKFTEIEALLRGEQSKLTAEQALEFIAERKAQTIKKNSSGTNTERKPTAQQVENAGIKEQILEVMRSAEKPMTSSEIGKAVGVENNYRVSALLGQMVRVTASGKENPEAPLVRSEVKGRAYFALAE